MCSVGTQRVNGLTRNPNKGNTKKKMLPYQWIIKEKLFSSGISHDWLESSCDDSDGGHDVDAVEDDLDLPPRRWMPEQSRGSS